MKQENFANRFNIVLFTLHVWFSYITCLIHLRYMSGSFTLHKWWFICVTQKWWFIYVTQMVVYYKIFVANKYKTVVCSGVWW